MYTIKIQKYEDLWHKMAMSDNEERKEYVQIYHRRDLSNGGKQEPGDTLMKKRHISIVVSSEPVRTASTAPVSKAGVPNQTWLRESPDGTSQGA